MQVTMQSNTNINNKTLVVGVPEHLNQISELTIEDENIIEKLEELKRNQIINTNVGTISSTLFSLNGKKLKLITVGLGNLKTTNYSDFLKVFGNLFQYLKKDRITQASLLFDTFGSQVITIDTVAEILGQQSEQATYQFDGYKTNKMPPYQLDLDIHTESSAVHTFVKQGLIIGSSINLARDYSNIPPNILTPGYYAECIQNHFKDTDVAVDIKDSDTVQREGFGLIHAVGKGSKHGPRVITLTYNGGNADAEPIALVGKGITYDSGGYSIKPKIGMQTMKYDMCGSANVIAMIEAARQLKLKVNIVGVIAAAENMVNEIAMKPDDVYTALNGESVEVLNTDAEGRLALGDAVFYANQFQPQVILGF